MSLLTIVGPYVIGLRDLFICFDKYKLLLAIKIWKRKTTIEHQKSVEENKIILNDVDSLKQRIAEAEDVSMNIRVDLDKTKKAFNNSLNGQNEELKTLIKNTEREIQSRSNDNLEKQNIEV